MPDIIRPDFSRFGKLPLLRTDRIGDLLVSTPVWNWWPRPLTRPP